MSETLKPENTNAVCDVCGRAATHTAVDVTRHEPPGQSFAAFSPHGPVKYGCDAHPVKSVEYLSSQPAPES